MRVWRDIPPARAWQTLLQPVIDSLKNRETQVRMSNLLDAIKLYDLLRKDAIDTLEDRARLLDIIADQVDEIFATAYKFHVGQVARDTKTGKAALKARGETSSAFYVKGDHKIPLAALSRRARTKAGYLRALAAHYRSHADSINPQAFIDSVFRAPQVKQGKAIGLVPGVRLEGVDPAGRGWEVTWDPGTDDITVANSMGIYAKRWLTQLRRDATTPPLFVWLEAQEVCQPAEARQTSQQAERIRRQCGRRTRWAGRNAIVASRLRGLWRSGAAVRTCGSSSRRGGCRRATRSSGGSWPGMGAAGGRTPAWRWQRTGYWREARAQ
jgi:hypothetical protein